MTSTERIDRKRSGWVDPIKRPTGPNGRPLCRWCEQEIPNGSGRRTFCSDACVTEHRIRTDPGFVREAVFRRDKGVCASCGLDTHALERTRPRHHSETKPGNPWADDLIAKGFPDNCVRFGTSLWAADHIVPVVKGGGACGLENYRTLCVPCHRLETTRLAAERAAERKLAKEAELGIVRLPLVIE